MTIKINMLTLGIASTNCYIVGDQDSREGVIIDAPDNPERILAVVEREGWTVRELLATHAHFDHVLAMGDLKRATHAPFRLHRDDLDWLHSLPLTVQRMTGREVPAPPEPDIFVQEGDTITVGAIKLEVLFTPGHAPGHVSYVMRNEQVVFSGDCLFYDSIGRTDLPGCDHPTLMRSIIEKLFPLGDDFQVAPGHMQMTTIGRERLNNPFVLDWIDATSR